MVAYGHRDPIAYEMTRNLENRLSLSVRHFFVHSYAKLSGPNRPFPSCIEPRYEIEAKCKVLMMKISFHSYANKANFHMKRFALSLAFVMRYTATRKWLIVRNPSF